jgi:hypothetical protein
MPGIVPQVVPHFLLDFWETQVTPGPGGRRGGSLCDPVRVGDLLVQRLHVDLMRTGSAACRTA